MTPSSRSRRSQTLRALAPMALAPMALALLCVFLNTGCAFYFPSFSNRVTCNKRITKEAAGFIQPGKTTRAEVIAAFGSAYRETRSKSAMAYPWETPAGVYVAGLVFYYFVATTEREFTHWHGFFIAYDQQGVVTRTEFRRLSGKLTLDDHLRKWTNE